MGNPENLETKIVETAKQMFVKNGYSQTSMSDIATALGINRPTLHYYFRTKDKLFEATFVPIIESFLPKIEGIFSMEIPIEEKLEKIIDAYIGLYLENPFLPQFIIGESQRDIENLFDTIKRLKFNNYVLVVENLMKSEIAKGTIKDIPIRILFLAFIGQIITPFLAKNLVKKAFDLNEETYRDFILEWKSYILKLLKMLLLN
ncbi:TetR/AcrR family transcriptional regulator [Bacteroidales bacterium OttesenSCG-928-A17]|nr:TetR/AcrR family transcriptional regulator [Bacteroidales bacterium OttesenSCG-928-A17]